MTLHEAPRAQADRHRRQYHRNQRRQPQVALRLVERVAHGGLRFFEVLDAFAAFEARTRPVLERLDGTGFARHVDAVACATAHAEQLAGGEIGDVDERTRRKTDEIAAAIGFKGQQRRDAQVELAEFDDIANLGLQGCHQALVQPHLARRRQATRDRIGFVETRRGAQHTAQRVAVLHRLHARQLGAMGIAEHAGEQHRIRRREAARTRLVGDSGTPRMVRA